MLSKTVVNRPTTFFVAFALLAGFGLYTAIDLPVDLLPEIQPAVLVVQTSFDGAGPEEVERSVTRLLEGVLSNVGSLNQVSSTSSRGSSQITLEFTWGTNMDEATNEVRDRLERVRNVLPDGAGSPSILKFDPSLIPLMQLRVTGNRSPEELREIAVDLIQPRIEQIDGIALTQVSGGRERVVLVEIPQSRLDAYGLTLNQIAGALRSQNVQVGGGSIVDGERSYIVQTVGEFRSIDDLGNAVVARRLAERSEAGDAPIPVGVRLRDIAQITDGLRPERSAVYVNGVPGVSISVQKQSDANSVRAADNVLAQIDAINAILPAGVRLQVLVDTTQIIRDSLATVSSQAITGAVLAVVILFLFLRSLKATLVVAISIPTSIIFTITLMYFWGLTLNLMTLAGLALGVGLLVDNSIVILENIYRYREKGAKLKPAAVLGTQEMINAILSATLTTICVFLPVALFRDQLDIVGELFSGLAFTVVISLSASLLVAVFLVPVLASHYFPLASRTQRPLHGLVGRIDAVMGRAFDGLDSLYKRGVARVLRRKTITLIVVIVAFVGSFAMLPRIGFELFPAQEQDTVQLTVTLPVGTRLDVTRGVLQDLERIVSREIVGYTDVVLNVGGGGGFGGGGATHRGNLTITLPPFDQRIDTELDIERKLRPYFDRLPGAVITFGGGGFGGGAAALGGGSPVTIIVRTEDIAGGRRVAEQIRDLLDSSVPEVVDPRLNISEGLPQVEIVVDRERAYSFGLDVATIGREVRAALDGISASQLRVEGRERDIVLILDPRDRSQVPDLDRIHVATPQGVRIPLSNVASYARGTGPVSIQRRNQARQFRVEAGLAPGAQAAQIEPQIRAMIAERIPPEDGMVIEFDGEFESIIRYGTTFAGIILVAVLLVFGVMAAQFESFVDPFIIFFSIPLTLIGVIGIHLIAGVNLSVFAAVGLVMLVGIVVNNGIVLVDYTNLLRARGLPIDQACVEAGGNRLRPILMTTLTTVLGLVPIAFFEGEGSQLIRPIALTVIGGLTVSSVLTLFFVPVLYAIFNRGSERRIARRTARLERRYEHNVGESSPDTGGST
ncbi:MAG: efflux RND transporter permease subunit [Spirochaetaceae bacterium]|nr:MAG: efflux RND transporter permease subunit [Spirochaetaceae bacterium]